MTAAGMLVDGAPATAEDLAHQALVNYGAYTSFRVEGGAVRGLDLHLARLEAAAAELFGEPVGEARLRALMRRALEGRDEAWLRVSLFAPGISHREPAWRGKPRVMTVTTAPPPPLADGLRVQAQTYGREAPHLKHAATFGLVRARRAALAAGFDDALFVGADGTISEGTLWNVGFVAGDTVVWPLAAKLAGTAQALVEAGLAGAGLRSETRPVRLAQLARFEAAFLCNSATPAAAIAGIDGTAFRGGGDTIGRLRAAWRSNPCQPI